MSETEPQRIALVTGATRGIGAAIADQLAAQNCRVIGTATSEAGAAQISTRLAPMGGAGYVLNLSDVNAVPALLEQITADVGAPEILVNNAGITRDNLMVRLADEDWDNVINTNLGGSYRLCRAVLKSMMRARWGRIINITSVVASMGNPGQANYAAAKAGLEGLTRSMARELGSRSITANCVAPGFIDTDMTRGLPEKQRDAMLTQIPLRRLGSATEIGQVVAFLCSDAAAYITGQTLHVNGGMYLG